MRLGRRRGSEDRASSMVKKGDSYYQMINFSYERANSPDAALEALQRDKESRLVAGGTDLIPLMKEDIVAPAVLVDISAWKEGSRIKWLEDRLYIGGLASLSSIAVHGDIRQSYAALAEACEVAATQQLRNMGTIGGNLLQQTRCWYYRGPHDCWLKGGSVCFARGGENEYHSIFDTDPQVSTCVSAHPSDPATALLALDARIRYMTTSGASEIPIAELFALPDDERRDFTTLPHDAILTEIVLPAVSKGGRSVYVKGMARAAWSFALASIAIHLELDGARIGEARVALGGVAPIPMRSSEVESQLNGAQTGSVDSSYLAELLVKDARPLAHNGYKVALLRGLFQEALDKVLS